MTIKTNYPSDLKDEEWQEIQELFTFKQSSRGRKPKYSRRIILNAIFYILRTGCQWRYLPKDFPPWKTVYTQYRRWEHQNCFEEANRQLVKRVRISLGRQEESSGAIVDSQSVKTSDRGGLRGFDAGKKNQR
jgi:putative transposase